MLRTALEPAIAQYLEDSAVVEHDASTFRYGTAFGVDRSDDLIFVQITVFDTRTAAQKKALYQRIGIAWGKPRHSS
jgi:hypothetical protein